MALILSVAALVAVLGFALLRPHGWPEAVVAVPAAALVIVTGAISWHGAWDEVRELAPVVGFLAAVLVLARLCDDEGLFHAIGVLMARATSGGQREFVAVLARAAVAVGVAGLFIETHPDPDQAPSDGPNMVPLRAMPALLAELQAFDRLAKARTAGQKA